MKTWRLGLIALFCLLVSGGSGAAAAWAQNFDISSGGQPTIVGALNGSVSGSSSTLQNLAVTVNFGEVSPLNPNPIVKVTVPILIRGTEAYQVTVAATGTAILDPRAIQPADAGFGVRNVRASGSKSQLCTNSAHVVASPFNNDPALTAAPNASGRIAYQSSVANISAGATVLTGPKLTQGNSRLKRSDDGYIFDAIFTVTPQFYAPGAAPNATLIFTISAGPAAPC